MATAKMSVADLERFLRAEFPQDFSNGDIKIESADGAHCFLRQRYNDRMLRPGGTISGPTLMALADFAMYVVLLSAIGPTGLAVTTNLNINFLRKGTPGNDVLAGAKLLKLGQATSRRGSQPALRHIAGSNRARHGNLFYSKYLEIFVVV